MTIDVAYVKDSPESGVVWSSDGDGDGAKTILSTAQEKYHQRPLKKLSIT